MDPTELPSWKKTVERATKLETISKNRTDLSALMRNKKPSSKFHRRYQHLDEEDVAPLQKNEWVTDRVVQVVTECRLENFEDNRVNLITPATVVLLNSVNVKDRRNLQTHIKEEAFENGTLNCYLVNNAGNNNIGAHYSVTIVKKMNDHLYGQVLDSSMQQGSTVTKSCGKIFERVKMALELQGTLFKCKSPQQSDASSCGLHAIENTVKMVYEVQVKKKSVRKQIDLTYDKKRIKTLRLKILGDIARYYGVQ